MEYRQSDREKLVGILRLTTALVLHRIVRRIHERLNKRKKRTVWVKPWLMRRFQLGAYDSLMVELANEDIEGYVAFQRLAPNLFG